MIEDGRVRAQGTLSERATGIVRLQLVFRAVDRTRTQEVRTQIEDGRFAFDEPLPDGVRALLAQRQGAVHSYTFYTGDFERRLRGELESFRVREVDAQR